MVSELEEALAVASALCPLSVLLDAQPILVDWNGALAPSWPHVLIDLADRLPTVVDVAIVSNAINFDVSTTRALSEVAANLWTGARVHLVTAARKPWRTRQLRALPRPMLMIGDQPLTDGLLAWRLDCAFIEWPTGADAPSWPRWQRRLGHVVAPFVFRTARENGGSRP